MSILSSTQFTDSDARADLADRIHVSVTAPSDTVALCAVAGEVDVCTADILRGALLGAVDSGVPIVVVDLSRVLFFGVAGLHVLVQACALLGEAGRTLRLVTGPRCVDRVLEVAGVGSGFERVPDLAAAVLT
ncbi:STAS domain-containing protein [Nocardia bovistercoris]|uniref:STAS domain-containing protein n=1 Tax=Nocardia bovistercoris TaxID=2785916 RepID=A0A931IC39_9NOCA|nr:STAS domain-containing protein [Nocardia bovistercoris]MBH0777115.1 STAS domain-containing protein [Nocardia bovistercoris]